MDTQTVAAYDTLAETFAREWREQPAPDDLYALLRRVFKAGGDTVDIGCGAGREVAWLNANGYPAVGYDASAGLLEAARTQYPGLSFRRAMLPSWWASPRARSTTWSARPSSCTCRPRRLARPCGVCWPCCARAARCT